MRGDEGAATLEVADHGVGIEPQHLGRIFGRFEHAVSARRYGRLGLRLYSAHQIIRAMDGDVRVSSTPGRGSTFHVTILRVGSAAQGARNEDVQ